MSIEVANETKPQIESPRRVQIVGLFPSSAIGEGKINPRGVTSYIKLPESEGIEFALVLLEEYEEPRNWDPTQKALFDQAAYRKIFQREGTPPIEIFHSYKLEEQK